MAPHRASVRDQDAFTLVELMVSMLVLGIVLSGVTSVVVSTLRVETDQQELQQVIDDGRLSLTRIRQEVREARRILEGSDGRHLYFWVDRNQDSLIQPEELVCYATEALDEHEVRFRIARWSGAVDGCDRNNVPVGAQTLAATLIDPEPFVGLVPEVPTTVSGAPTREVSVLLDLEVENARELGSIQVTGSIRLRNVP